MEFSTKEMAHFRQKAQKKYFRFSDFVFS